MNLKFDKRAVLIPVAGLVATIANGNNFRYSDDQRRAMVECVLRDTLERMGAREELHTLNTPQGKVGRRYSELTKYLGESKPSSIVSNEYNHKLLIERVRIILAKHSLYEACVADGQSDENIIGLGYSLSWFSPKGKVLPLSQKHIVITWTRPRLNQQSMSVPTFVKAITDELISRKYSREQVEQTINAMPLRELLSSYPYGAMAEDIREYPYQTWEGLLQYVTSRLKGGLK
ncbi:hypothetical protein pEaSNUABM11_00109 [Erwinia phage pEa_SNUABM_11]|nr:hypothetical protein pEaSNUABM11_00109 [Erwinia phage pEa_SNUABM_11]